MIPCSHDYQAASSNVGPCQGSGANGQSATYIAVTKVFFKTAFHLDVPVGLRNGCMKGRRTTQHTTQHTHTHKNTQAPKHTTHNIKKGETRGRGDW